MHELISKGPLKLYNLEERNSKKTLSKMKIFMNFLILYIYGIIFYNVDLKNNVKLWVDKEFMKSLTLRESSSPLSREDVRPNQNKFFCYSFEKC